MTTITTPAKPVKRVLAGGAAAAAVVALAAAPAPANATAWDPHVRLQGAVTCGSYPNGKVTGLWLWTAQDGGRWIGYSGRRYSEGYAVDFWRVPTSTTTVYYTVYCSGFKSSGAFGLNRPTWGTTATRNIYYRY